jgi:hypothetical protein
VPAVDSATAIVTPTVATRLLQLLPTDPLVIVEASTVTIATTVSAANDRQPIVVLE